MLNLEKNFISAVIYVHNAEDRIEEFLSAIIDTLKSNFEHSEIICVNDCSEDNSADIIKKVSKNVDGLSISILNMSYFHGVEASMTAGLDLSIGDFVFEFDKTYLDFDVKTIMDIYHHALEGFDIVSAGPENSGKLSSKLFYKAFDAFTIISYKMNTESFRVLSRRCINRIGAMNKTVPYRKALYANCGLKTDMISYKSSSTKKRALDKRESKYRRSLAVDSLILFTDLGYRFSMTMTLLMMLVSIFMVVYSLVIYLSYTPVEGWTTTILFLSFAFMGLFGIMTVVVKYLQLLINLIFKRKQYNFESIEKLTK